ncbi:MAG: RNA-binding S4 domain-containing protein [Myxococcales bacterium]|jgi:ribosome-associated heat shock protein Hsp15|nr:RNA-binding S4 domain-containing protein [Myxococcales bacterium]
MDAVRVDRWLCAARIFKSRTAAQDACVGGHVRVNQHAVRASHLLRVGDRVEASAPRGRVVLIVVALADKRLSPPAARLLYEDHSPPPPPPEPKIGVRDRGAGRPTKADRRQLERLRGG